MFLDLTQNASISYCINLNIYKMHSKWLLHLDDTQYMSILLQGQ